MSMEYNDKYRIKKSKAHESLMQKLSKLKMFEGYQNLMCYSALIGYINNKYTEFTAQSEPIQIINWQNTDRNMMDFLAYIKEGRQDILQNQGDPKYLHFSYYAYAGFEILIDKLGITEDTIIDENVEMSIAKTMYQLLLTGGFYLEEDLSTGE